MPKTPPPPPQPTRADLARRLDTLLAEVGKLSAQNEALRENVAALSADVTLLQRQLFERLNIIQQKI